MANPYFRYRARNPYRPPTPALQELESPTFDQPMPTMAPVIEAAPLRAVAPPPAPSVLDLLDRERAAYEAKVPTTTGGRILEALKTAGLGALQAAAQNPNDPLGAAIGGAAAGGLTSAVNPQMGRAYQFETYKRPDIEARLQREELARRKAQSEAEFQLKAQETAADIDLKRSQAQKNRTPEPLRARAPVSVAPGSVLVDPETGRLIFAASPREARPPAPHWAR